MTTKNIATIKIIPSSAPACTTERTVVRSTAPPPGNRRTRHRGSKGRPVRPESTKSRDFPKIPCVSTRLRCSLRTSGQFGDEEIRDARRVHLAQPLQLLKVRTFVVQHHFTEHAPLMKRLFGARRIKLIRRHGDRRIARRDVLER